MCVVKIPLIYNSVNAENKPWSNENARAYVLVYKDLMFTKEEPQCYSHLWLHADYKLAPGSCSNTPGFQITLRHCCLTANIWESSFLQLR